MLSILKPTKQNTKLKTIFGFDIETYSDKNHFYMASVWSENENFCQTFYNKEECIKHFTQKRFQKSIIACSNLSFDFFGLMFGSDFLSKFTIFLKGSNLLFASTYIYNGEFHKKKLSKNHHKLIFIDTFNYASLSVDNLGKLIGVHKLEKPKCLGTIPQSMQEEYKLRIYNMQDSKVSALGLKFLYETFIRLGATPKLTIASTSMSLFRNKYLKENYFRQPKEELLELFNGYYGGRTEALVRGIFKSTENIKYNYYDFNSLYPSQMLNKFPNPNSKRITHNNTDYYINNYEGMSHIDIFCPYDKDYPLLPIRHDNKLIFPIGDISGWYTHIEIRKAIELGYVLKKVHKTYYYTKNCSPFNDFINDMYNLRQEFKKENNPMEYVVKIIMNALSGKFGQKFNDKDNYIHESMLDINNINKYKNLEPIGDGTFFRVSEDIEPTVFCIPIWISYITAYARIKLNQYMNIAKPLYVDTDSLITTKLFKDSKELGELKLEYSLKSGIIVKPKMYLINYDNKTEVKSKGIGFRLCSKDFFQLLETKKVKYDKFIKFKESVRRGIGINAIIEITKHLDLEDNKRKWINKFNPRELEFSEPINMDKLNELKEKELIEKSLIAYNKEKEKELKSFIDSDLFDKNSVGNDITSEEFIKNEQFFETL